MKIRPLELKDAERMLEWMRDDFVVEKMRTNFALMEIEDCWRFIEHSHGVESVHFAIADDRDVYMGTISLKHIANRTAEFAIVMHREAMGKGYAKWGMQQLFKLASDKYQLNSVYWCVEKKNLRALRFYDKNGYHRVDSKCLNIYGDYHEEEIESYIWYFSEV